MISFILKAKLKSDYAMSIIKDTMDIIIKII